MDKETELVFKYEDELLNIIDNRDLFSRGDLQGAIEAQLRLLIKEVKNI
jgi:hypothetical protein